MSNIVLSKVDKLDLNTTLTAVEVVDSVESIAGDTTFILEITDKNLAAIDNSSHSFYIPSTALSAVDQDTAGLRVYFDLENYPFYQAAKAIITKEAKPKGVFRYRRTVKQGENDAILASDLFVLSSLLGEAQDVQVKRTNAKVTPSHTIIMINFGGGTMAHVEYTVSDHERIELEWSGDKNIIEFDSNEMRPIQPGSKTKLPLVYPVDTILATAYEVDQNLVDQLNHFESLIDGGAHK